MAKKGHRGAVNTISVASAREAISQLAPEEQQLLKPSAAEAFLAKQDKQLGESARLWQSVAATFEPFSNGQLQSELAGVYPEALDAVNEMSDKGWKMDDNELKAKKEQVLRNLNKIVRELATLTLTFASSHAAEIVASDNHQDFFLKGLDLEDPTVDPAAFYICQSDSIWPAVSKLPNLIVKGDQLRKQTVARLVKIIGKNPSILDELTILYGSNDRRGSHICELQKMCAVDWHQPDQSSSVLRGFIEQTRHDEDKFLPDFINAVETAKLEDEKMAIIKHMSQFAMAAQGIDISDGKGIGKALLSTRSQWSSFVEIETAYRKFRDIKIKELEKSLTAFVGTTGSIRGDVRYPLTKIDYKIVLALFDDYFDSDSKKRRRDNLALMSGRQIPAVEQIVAGAEAEPTLELALLKKVVNNGWELQSFDLPKLLKGFSDDPRMLKEMQGVIDSLAQDPRGLGTKLLHRDNDFRVNGKVYRAREFKPGERPALKVSRQRYRLIYTITNSQVAISEIIRREKLSKDY